jgi:hypothetical protein
MTLSSSRLKIPNTHSPNLFLVPIKSLNTHEREEKKIKRKKRKMRRKTRRKTRKGK